MVFRDTAIAKVLFRELKADADTPSGLKKPALQIGTYGDEQVATLHTFDGARLMVRKGAFVWALELQTLIGDRELARAEAAKELGKYGARQAWRVANG